MPSPRSRMVAVVDGLWDQVDSRRDRERPHSEPARVHERCGLRQISGPRARGLSSARPTHAGDRLRREAGREQDSARETGWQRLGWCAGRAARLWRQATDKRHTGPQSKTDQRR